MREMQRSRQRGQHHVQDAVGPEFVEAVLNTIHYLPESLKLGRFGTRSLTCLVAVVSRLSLCIYAGHRLNVPAMGRDLPF